MAIPETNPEFSVIIPTRNRGDFLAEAIASVRAQTIDDLEIVVVDDGSDPPMVVAEDIVVVRHEQSRGPAAARNAGVEASSGLALTFLDDDDLWVSDRLMLARRGLQRAPIAVCFSRYVGESARRAGRGRMLEGDVSVTIREGMTPNLGQTAIRRSAWLPLDETNLASDDVDWWIRVSQRYAVATEPEVGFLYRMHTGPRTATGPQERINCALQILEDHSAYFDNNRRAAGFHWFRIGLTADGGGDRRTARRALWRSMRLRPSGRTAYHLVRVLF